ncbi:MAG: Gfo/Idh/MocA family protein [Verrucomicrobiota bacterium]
MTAAPVRWGILGTAGIARKNWEGIRLSGNGVVTAVASRNPGRARDFIRECQAEAPFAVAPEAVDGYAALLARADVDAVYLPLPTAPRAEWIRRAARAGKHVVGEKPCAVDAATLASLLGECRQAGVQFMDGVMFMHSRRLDAVRAVLDDGGTIGRVRRVTSAFSFAAPDDFAALNIRGDARLEPQGCLGDLGWYCLRFTLWTLGWEMPRRVTARIHASFQAPGCREPVPAEASAELEFAGGVTAGFHCSFVAANQQWAHVSGTRGLLRIPDFVLPQAGAANGFETSRPVYRVRGCDFAMEPHDQWHPVAEASHRDPSAQEVHLFRNFARQVQSGRLNPDWPDWALRTQQVLDACLESGRDDGTPVVP